MHGGGGTPLNHTFLIREFVFTGRGRGTPHIHPSPKRKKFRYTFHALLCILKIEIRPLTYSFSGSDGYLQFWCFIVSLKPVLAKAHVCVFPSSYSVHLCIPIWPKCLIPKYSPSPYFATQPHHKDVSSSISIFDGIVSVEGTFWGYVSFRRLYSTDG